MDGEFDYSGPHFHSRLLLRTKAAARCVLMSAGNSTRGRSSRPPADFNFVVAQDVQALRAVADNG